MKVWTPVAKAFVLVIDRGLECTATHCEHWRDPSGYLELRVEGALEFFKFGPRGFDLEVRDTEVGVFRLNPFNARRFIDRRWG